MPGQYIAGLQYVPGIDGLTPAVGSGLIVSALTSGVATWAFVPVPRTDATNTFTSLQTFASGIQARGTGGTDTVQIGTGATASASSSIAIGRASCAFAAGIAIGADPSGSTSVSGAGGIAIGSLASADGDCFAMGYAATANTGENICIGSNSSATHARTISIGRRVRSLAADQISLGFDNATNTAPTLRLVGNGTVSQSNRTLCDIATAWVDTTDATRKARTVLNAHDTAARECIRLEASGSAALIGFLGATAVARQSVGSAATDAATTQTLANALRTALINLGLCST